ncbi:MAG: ATP-binding protein, partial [Planctomycetes bacterium]|nr:ATP-binding protein [Planctomycetota bacterium]
IRMLEGTGITPLFPIWGQPTHKLARTMIEAGLKATITCIDPKQLDASFVGQEFDLRLLNDLPDSADPCGENGEFHTFVHQGPMFNRDLKIKSGQVVERDGFWFADVLPA